MNPGDRAHRRWPVPEEVKLALATHYRMSEYERARVYDYFAVLYSVIDGLMEERNTAVRDVTSHAHTIDDLCAMIQRQDARIKAIEDSLALPAPKKYLKAEYQS